LFTFNYHFYLKKLRFNPKKLQFNYKIDEVLVIFVIPKPNNYDKKNKHFTRVVWWRYAKAPQRFIWA
ncbi:hypothetical protein PG335_11060, partial [Riemerella anatipestifer]|nr:hypothetical protein [Riemerella anatipestifer]MDY3421342.1 hypothetical protein [Riemerella anatipestifer]